MRVVDLYVNVGSQAAEDATKDVKTRWHVFKVQALTTCARVCILPRSRLLRSQTRKVRTVHTQWRMQRLIDSLSICSSCTKSNGDFLDLFDVIGSFLKSERRLRCLCLCVWERREECDVMGCRTQLELHGEAVVEGEVRRRMADDDQAW